MFKQYNLVPANGRWYLVAGKVTVGLASHWPRVTDISGSPSTGSRPKRWAIDHPHALLWSMVDFSSTMSLSHVLKRRPRKTFVTVAARLFCKPDAFPVAAQTSCVGDRHNMPPAPASSQYLHIYSPGRCAVWHDNIFTFIRQVAPVPACWLFKTSAISSLWPFDL